MIPNEDNLFNWLKYKDVTEPTDPKILIQGYGEDNRGKPDQVGWLRDAYAVYCRLVQPEHAKSVKRRQDFYAGQVHPWWTTETEFDFGEVEYTSQGEELETFVFQIAQPITNQTVTELRQDFVIYHKLEKKENVYFHNGENVEIAWIIEPNHQDRLAEATVHLDFLKDYLAARHCCLLVSSSRDRFAAVGEITGIDEEELSEIGPGVWRKISICDNYEGLGFYLIRSTLWRNDIILPYSSPKKDRNPWNIDIGSKTDTNLLFYINNKGDKGSLAQVHMQSFLHFRREVLRHYLTTPGFSVYFHMRKWGIANNSVGQYTDVGINEEGQVTALAKDIQKLPANQQAHWAHYSCYPAGDVCKELFATRMMCNPPDSTCVYKLIDDARNDLDRIFQELVNKPLYSENNVQNQDINSITIGPLVDSMSEIASLGKILYQLTIELMDVKILREITNAPFGDETPTPGSIRCLQELIVLKTRCTPDEAKNIIMPLKSLNDLRVIDAHPTSKKENDILKMYGFQTKPNNYCVLWDKIVDQTIETLKKIIEAVRDVNNSAE